MRTRVRSLALFSGLTIQRCCELWCRSQVQLGSCVAVAVAVAVAQAGSCSSKSAPSLGASTCHRHALKGQKRERERPPTPSPSTTWGPNRKSATYTTAHRNARSLTHWARPGIEPSSSWILVAFVIPEPHIPEPPNLFRFLWRLHHIGMIE